MSNARIRRKRVKRSDAAFIYYILGKFDGKESRKLRSKYGFKHIKPIEFTGLANRYEELSNGREE